MPETSSARSNRPREERDHDFCEIDSHGHIFDDRKAYFAHVMLGSPLPEVLQ